MPPSAALIDKAKKLIADLKSAGLTVITAESCTCGRLACLLAAGEGASEVLHGGFITYTKQNKTASLGVSSDTPRTKGAVCEEVGEPWPRERSTGRLPTLPWP